MKKSENTDEKLEILKLIHSLLDLSYDTWMLVSKIVTRVKSVTKDNENKRRVRKGFIFEVLPDELSEFYDDIINRDLLSETNSVLRLNATYEHTTNVLARMRRRAFEAYAKSDDLVSFITDYLKASYSRLEYFKNGFQLTGRGPCFKEHDYDSKTNHQVAEIIEFFKEYYRVRSLKG